MLLHRVNYVLFFLLVLGVTLRSIYIYSISLAPLPIISIFISFLLCLLNKDKLRDLTYKLDFICFFIFLIVFFALAILLNLIHAISNVNLNSIIGIILSLIFFICLYSLRNVFLQYKKVFNYILVFHMFFFFFQFFMFYAFNEKVDYLVSITGEAQRFNGFSDIEGAGLAMFRPVGLFTEPGNYSIHVLAILWLAYLSKSITPILEKLVLISVFLSFSLTGMFCACLYFVLTRNMKFDGRYILFSSILFAVIAFYFGELVVNYLSERIGNILSDNSANVRVSAFEQVFNMPPSMQLFGAGLGNDVVDIHLPTIPYLLVTFGLVGSFCIILAFILISIKSQVSLRTYLFFCAISFQFYTLMHPLFWLFWFGVLAFSEVNKEQNRIEKY